MRLSVEVSMYQTVCLLLLQDCELLSEVCGWINAKATVPVWGKMTPNITDITFPARAALENGG